LRALHLPALRLILTMKVILLVIGAVMAIRLGPFLNGDGWPAIATGMVLVSAMAIQNAVHRIHLAAAPPTTLMTGTTTQMMIDIADLLRGAAPETRDATSARLRRMSASVGAFALGCGCAALFFAGFGVWCFVLPPVIGAAMLALRVTEFEKPA
jgi:uncharacterized membrane protein YoaK (UPF0700 family)